MRSAIHEDGQLITATPEEAEEIRRISDELVKRNIADVHYALTDTEHSVVLELPRSLFSILLDAARSLARGRSVAIVHYGEELTTQQAADLLGVSRPYLIGLLEKGQIRHHKTGSHRRIRMGDLEAYRQTRDARRRADMQELMRVSESLGLYDEDLVGSDPARQGETDR